MKAIVLIVSIFITAFHIKAADIDDGPPVPEEIPIYPPGYRPLSESDANLMCVFEDGYVSFIFQHPEGDAHVELIFNESIKQFKFKTSTEYKYYVGWFPGIYVFNISTTSGGKYIATLII